MPQSQVIPPRLTIDRGNSTLDVMLHAAAGEGFRRRFDPADHAGLEACVAGLPADVVGAAVSVVPGGLDWVRTHFRSRGLRLAVAGVDLPCPLRLDYETTETLGADRWVGAWAAYRLVGACVVVDCGTATTVQMVAADGVFQGGAIAPGLPAMVAGMRAVTPGLPAAEPAQGDALPARSSRQSVHSGVLWSFWGAVDRLVKEALAGSERDRVVVVTGGNAPLYVAHAARSLRHEPDLVHTGLSLLLDAAGAGWEG